MPDPRKGVRISERDIRALTFIGEGYEVAQYQLQAAIFPKVSAVVVSHFVTRAVRNGWIAVERWNRVGINRLRLTSTGRRVVMNAGGDPVALFVPKKPVATKDLTHTLWINDVRLVLQVHGSFEAVLPAWQLQRRMVPPPPALPDILAIRGGEKPLVFACEIDLGGERLRHTFFPKLELLSGLLSKWSGTVDSRIIVLTKGPLRALAVEEFARKKGLPVVARNLPRTSGWAAFQAFVELEVLGVTVKSN